MTTTEPQDTKNEARPGFWRGTAQLFAADLASFPGIRELRTEPRPPLNTVWAYADRGKYAPPVGGMRTAGRIYNRIYATPQITRLRYREWIAERPTREFVYRAAGVTFLFTPMGGWCAHTAATVFEWLSTLHTLI